jgi:rhodanese-related sulfurtransferase
MTSAPEPRLIDIDIPTLLNWVRRDEVLVVDVRESEEFAEERIPGSVALPLSRFDAGLLPRAPGKRTVLTCFIGGRSAQAAERLFAAGHREAMHLDGGLFGWKEAGLATERGPANANKPTAAALSA